MRITLVHFHPLEMYPPVMNFLNYLAGSLPKSRRVKMHTTANLITTDKYENPFIEITRTKHPGSGKNLLTRFFLLIKFNFVTFLNLKNSKPQVIIYYETFSAFPVFLYIILLKKERRPALYIHYHEYTTHKEYSSMPIWVRINFWIEKRHLWKAAKKISHTNAYRLNLFSDNFHVDKSKLLEIPNYPPQSWSKFQNSKTITKPIKIVYIGSLSFEDTYIREFAEFIGNKADFTFDIYSYNHKPDVKKYFFDNKFSNISFHPEGLFYFDLPKILKEYHIGVILYKAKTMNVIYCASNKLFEYLACGLDVWVTKEMTGSDPYCVHDRYPKVVMVDFAQLSQFDPEEILSKKNLLHSPSQYFCEPVYRTFAENF